MVEQRYLAVREMLETGGTITDVARRYGVDRRCCCNVSKSAASSVAITTVGGF